MNLEDIRGIIGEIAPPPTLYGGFNTEGGGIVGFVTNILRLIFVVAGVYALFNFILAGYGYMTAGGDTKKLDAAWAKIWQTLIGLVIIVGSFALAGLFSKLIFGRADFILNPVIYGPGL